MRGRGGHEGHGVGHGHALAGDADRSWLIAALALVVGFMVVEVVVGLIAGSLALLSDAAHMLSDAAAIALALLAIRLAARPARGCYTYGLKRAEILSAQVNGITLLLLAVWFYYEGIARLIDPPQVRGALVLVTALVGIVVNIAAVWCISRANRRSLAVEGAFQHILNDLYSFIATAVAGLVILLTGFYQADAIAALVVATLMTLAGARLVRDSTRIFLEAAPENIDPAQVHSDMLATAGVAEVHDLHVWVITSGQPALSAHVLVEGGARCHAVRTDVERVLRDRYELAHSTLQVDHVGHGRIQAVALPAPRRTEPPTATTCSC